MLFAVLSGFLLAIGAPLLHRRLPRAAGWLLAGLPAGLFAYFLGQLPAISGGQRVAESHSWLPGLGVALSFSLDGLSLLFALLISGIGVLIFIYSSGYTERS